MPSNAVSYLLNTAGYPLTAVFHMLAKRELSEYNESVAIEGDDAMLSHLPLYKVIVINVILGILWHVAMFILCVARHQNSFSPDKKMYRPCKWEKDGKLYADLLKINRWKDFLPQHVGKDGFSKEHLENISLAYIDQFIRETCRGEWNHAMNCLFALILFILNHFGIALILTFLLLLGNVPFIIIQRYNRFRLQKLRRLIIRKTCRHTPDSSVPASVKVQDTIETE